MFTVSQDRLLALAHSWGTKEHGLDLLQLADENVHIPETLSALNFQFYRTASLASSADATTSETTCASQSTSPTIASAKPPTGTALETSNTSPTKQRRSSHPGSSASVTPAAAVITAANEGMVAIHVNNIRRLGTSDYDILAHLVKEYQVPEEHQFLLLNRIRVATGINVSQRRRQLLTIRILAVAVISHVLPEGDVIDKFLAFEPEIIQSLTELIHPDHKAPFVSIVKSHLSMSAYTNMMFSKDVSANATICILVTANCGTLCVRWIGSSEKQTRGCIDSCECLCKSWRSALSTQEDHQRTGH